jgi:hypothetical protein
VVDDLVVGCSDGNGTLLSIGDYESEEAGEGKGEFTVPANMNDDYNSLRRIGGRKTKYPISPICFRPPTPTISSCPTWKTRLVM